MHCFLFANGCGGCWVLSAAFVMSHYKYLIDAGHGGIDPTGRYTTAPSKMHTFTDGLVIYEGVINRDISTRVCELLRPLLIYFETIHDPVDDLSLAIRVAKADSIFHKDRSCIFLSIHSNAGGGKGFEVFTSKGQSKSDKIAKYFCDSYKNKFRTFSFRADQIDGDDDKESDFYVLRKTDCPAVLVENLFFDNREEAEYLLSDKGQRTIAECIVEAITAIERHKPI